MMSFRRKNPNEVKLKTSLSSSFSSCLLEKNVKASVVDVAYDVGIVGMTADYVISVSPRNTSSPTSSFNPFKISKTYKSFRKLGKSIVQTTELAADNMEQKNANANMIKFATSIETLIESQDREYLLRTSNKDHTNELSQQRSNVLNGALQNMCNNDCSFTSCSTGEEILKILEDFFSTDQVEPNNCSYSKRLKKKSSSLLNVRSISPFKKKRHSRGKIKFSHLVDSESKNDDMDKKSGQNDDVDKTSRQRGCFWRGTEHEVKQQKRSTISIPVTKVSFLIGVALLGILVALRAAQTITITLDLDTALLICFSLFCMGLHFSSLLSPSSAKPSEQKKQLTPVTRRSNLIHRPSLLVRGPSYSTTDGEVDEIDEEDVILKSPVPIFPTCANLGDHLNCWSMPDSTNFKVRGPGYLKDKKKIPSASFLLPARGMDLMLTDDAPENIGENPAILGGALREKPTFVINFRLPWGVVILYFEIPEKFVPFLRSCYETEYENKAEMSTLLASMSPAERCMTKFLQADQATKNKLLKIVPVVVQGPWVVRGVVNGKPAIVGKALPVTYLYERAEEDKALYLEADMDVVSSAAARNILSVVRNHTSSLTLDLGFVVQGNSEEELPEQMLGAVRCHGIDIYSCSPLPPMENKLTLVPSDSNDSGDSSS